MAKMKRQPRPLLVARAGMAVMAFGGAVACGGPGPMGSVCRGPCGTVGGAVAAATGSSGSGSSGSTGTGQQYCGIPDGGTPIPCLPDGGPDGTTGGGSGSTSGSGSGGTT